MARAQYKEYRGITLMARELRKNQTSSEKILWEKLRQRQMMGFKFLRQHPIFYRIINYRVDFFIADFYCAELKLVIELDGPIHAMATDYDKERDTKLSLKGLLTIRINNSDLENLEKVLEIIRTIVIERSGYFAEN
jgi:leucyl-tRNA synthetase